MGSKRHCNLHSFRLSKRSGNSYFEPFKTIPTEEHIIRSVPTNSEGEVDTLLKFSENEHVDYQTEDAHDGLFMQPTFRDSLFDIWKSQYTTGSTTLIKEIKSLTSDIFIASLSPAKVVGDIVFQVVAQVAALAGGKLGAIIGGAALSFLGPVGSAVGSSIGLALGYFFTYVFVNAMNAAAQVKKMNNYLRAQTTHNPSYEREKTLSAKWWDDEYFGDIMPNTIQGTPRGIYAEVKAETNKYSYKGQIILAPKGIDKTTNFGKNIKKLVLDYSQQTRGYLNYSDIKAMSKIIQVPFGGGTYSAEVPRDPDMLYMSNSIMFVEDAIFDATYANRNNANLENQDLEVGTYDQVIPYMTGVVPTLQFSDSNGGYALPEFYLEYPIFVSTEDYDSVKEEYHHIYKVYDGTTDILQLIPEKFVGTRTLMSDVVSVSTYFVDTLGKDYKFWDYSLDPTIEDKMIEFNPLTGQLMISTTASDFFNAYMGVHRKAHKDIPGYYGYIVIDVQIEKYRDIATTEDDTLHSVVISQEKANMIATTQSAHVSIMDYMYQYSIAKQTQERLSEIAYTAFVTAISTIISTAISFGAGAITKKLLMKSGAEGTLTKVFARAGSKSAQRLAATAGTEVAKKVGEEVVKKTIGQLIKGAFKSGSMIFAKLGKAIVMETFEELVVDPWIEAYVSKTVRDMGGDAWEQAFWSSFAESGRESFGSSVKNVMQSAASFSMNKQQQQQQALSQNQDQQLSEQQKSIIKDRQKQEARKAKRKELRNTIFSTVMMFAGVLGGGIFGSAGLGGFSNMLIAGSVGFDLYLDGRGIVEEGLKYKKSKATRKIDVHSEVSDEQKSRIVREIEQNNNKITLPDTQKTNVQEATSIVGMVNSKSDLLGNLVKIRISGAPVDQAIKSITIENSEMSIKDIHQEAENQFKLNPLLNYKYLYKGKVLSGFTKIAELKLKPSDVITVVGEQAGAAPIARRSKFEKLIWEGKSDSYLIRIYGEATLEASLLYYYDVKTVDQARLVIKNRFRFDRDHALPKIIKSSRRGKLIDDLLAKFPTGSILSLESFSELLFSDKNELRSEFLDDNELNIIPHPGLIEKIANNIKKITKDNFKNSRGLPVYTNERINYLKSQLLSVINKFKQRHSSLYFYFKGQNKFEKGVTIIAEYLLGVKFHVSKEGTLSWLRGRDGQFLELDGYAEIEIGGVVYKIAFEVNGEQHYKPIYGNEKFLRTIKNDQDKKEACRDNKVLLIEIPYTLIENGDIQKHIKKLVEDWTGETLTDKLPLSVDFLNKLIELKANHFLM